MGIALEDLLSRVGDELAVSDWLVVDAAHLELFHRATYITVSDVDLGYNQNSPMGPEVVDGFLLLSLLSHFHLRVQLYQLQAGAYGLNYGIDRVRFLTPVRAGQRVRCRIRLLDVEEKRRGHYVAKTENTIEVEGSEKPAMVAEWLNMIVVDGT
jgi:acyl dehydratase